MAAKRNVTFAVHPKIADDFRDMTKSYFGKLSLCFSAAMLQFLETKPTDQAQYIRRVFDAELNDEVDELLSVARQQQIREIAKTLESGSAKDSKRQSRK